MAVSEEGKTELSEPQVCMVEMAALLRARAPNLGPNVTPRPFKSVVRNILELCSTAQQRADAEAYLSSRAAAEKARASSDFDDECGDKGDEGKVDHKTEMHVVVKTETDVSTTTFRIISCEFAGKVDSTLHDLERLMELHLNSGQTEMEPYVERFASVNELMVRSDGQAASSAALQLQEVCSLAYTLQVAASNMPGWAGFVGSFQFPLADDVDMTAVMRELFEPPPPTPQSIPRPKSGGKEGGASRRGGKSKKAEGVARQGGDDKAGKGASGGKGNRGGGSPKQKKVKK